MSRIAYVNGQFMSHDFAAIHIEDRATQFGDGVYEVFAAVKGKLIDSWSSMTKPDSNKITNKIDKMI